MKYGCFDAVHIVLMLEFAQVILNNAAEYKKPQNLRGVQLDYVMF